MINLVSKIIEEIKFMIDALDKKKMLLFEKLNEYISIKINDSVAIQCKELNI